jgi:hypothetical protein
MSYIQLLTRISKKIIQVVLGFVVSVTVIIMLLGNQISSAAHSAIIDFWFKVDTNYPLPDNIKDYQHLISLDRQEIQTFYVNGNSSSKLTLIIVPGMKGVYYHTFKLMTDKLLLGKYRAIISYNYPQQGLTTGQLNQDTIIDTSHKVVKYYNKSEGNDIKIDIVCMSAGSISCTNIDFNKYNVRQMIILHPMLNSAYMVTNLYQGYYDTMDLSWIGTDWTTRSLLAMINNNKWVLRPVFSEDIKFDRLKTGNVFPNKLKVYIPSRDEFFQESQFQETFYKPLHTSAQFHSDLDYNTVSGILLQDL